MCLPSPRARAADLVGIALSSACLVHCLALPLALLVAPALGGWLRLPEWLHAAILMLALPAALIAMAEGWRRHRRGTAPLFAAAGVGLLAFGLAAHEGWLTTANPETADRLFSSAGAIALVTAHLLNWRQRHGTGHR
ncbi:MerC domain-containing protein [Sphingopyxis solisilvae]|uniref:MerC domain-containing protein n=1 Tax=Sphingopyxis solisilvae TaxID=1886788 RepID=UPI001892C156|nr:MerC domain-containing protein [Sphingopyxis solisilvae]